MLLTTSTKASPAGCMTPYLRIHALLHILTPVACLVLEGASSWIYRTRIGDKAYFLESANSPGTAIQINRCLQGCISMHHFLACGICASTLCQRTPVRRMQVLDDRAFCVLILQTTGEHGDKHSRFPIVERFQREEHSVHAENHGKRWDRAGYSCPRR